MTPTTALRRAIEATGLLMLLIAAAFVGRVLLNALSILLNGHPL